jgi:hypothetical protein
MIFKALFDKNMRKTIGFFYLNYVQLMYKNIIKLLSKKFSLAKKWLKLPKVMIIALTPDEQGCQIVYF